MTTVTVRTPIPGPYTCSNGCDALAEYRVRIWINGKERSSFLACRRCAHDKSAWLSMQPNVTHVHAEPFHTGGWRALDYARQATGASRWYYGYVSHGNRPERSCHLVKGRYGMVAGHHRSAAAARACARRTAKRLNGGGV